MRPSTSSRRGRRCTSASSKSRRRARAGVEWLEGRTLLAFFNPLVAAADGAIGTSLRDAIKVANANNQDDTIYLKVGTYELTLANPGGVQENANATGDLDVLNDNNKTLTIKG